MNEPTKKFLISILLGLAGFGGAYYSLKYNNLPFSIALTWSFCLPLLAGMVYGPRYGLIAGTVGLGAFFPFLLDPANGWANLVYSIFLVAWFSWVGYFEKKRGERPALWNHPFVVHLPFAFIFDLLMQIFFPIAFSFNPPFWNPQADLSMPANTLQEVITRGILTMYLAIIVDVCLLKIPPIRKMFNLEVKAVSRNNGWIVSGSFLASIIMWYVVIILNRIFIYKTFPQELLQVREPHEILALIVFVSSGLFMGSVICQYVESRLQAEEELGKSRESYRQIFEQAADGIFLADVQGNYLDVNESGCRLTGYTRDEILLHLNMRDLVMAEEQRNISARVNEINAGNSVVFERRMRHKDGSVLYVEISARKLADGRLQALVRDISQRKRAEEAQRRSEENYRQIFEQAADGIFISDVEGNFLDVNSSGCALIGYNRDEVLKLNLRDVLPREDEHIISLRLNEMKAGRVVINECKVLHKNGSLIDVEITGRILLDGRFQGVLRDISRRKRVEEEVKQAQAELQHMFKSADESRLALLSVAEDQKKAEEQILRLNAELEMRVKDRTAQLEAANQELEAFAYSVSHDLKAPLRTMNGFSAILQDDYAENLDEEGKNHLIRIQEAAGRMGQLINDLLNLSRVTRSPLTRQRVDLSALAHEISANLNTTNPQRQVELTIAPDMLAEGDPDLIKIVLENLLNNAYKFTVQRALTRIQVGMTEQSGERVYFVRDNGAGFDMAYAARLFAPFQRLHGIQEYPGTGIGLVTVRRIITRHGGRIWPEAAVDEGATFYFTLPFSPGISLPNAQ